MISFSQYLYYFTIILYLYISNYQLCNREISSTVLFEHLSYLSKVQITPLILVNMDSAINKEISLTSDQVAKIDYKVKFMTTEDEY